MEIKKLKHAVTLAEEGSFAKASTRLHMSQPALSRSIQLLESELGVSLFERHTTGVTPTKESQALLERARELLRMSNGILQEARLIQGAQSGQLAIGTGPIPAQWLLPDVLRDMISDAPNIKIAVETGLFDQLQELLLTEKIELFVASTAGKPISSDIRMETITSYSFGLFVKPDHPLLSSRATRAEQLYRFTLLSHGWDSSNPAIPGSDLDFGQWQAQISCDNPALLVNLALNSDSVLFTAEPAVRHQLARKELVMLKTPLFPAQNPSQVGVVSLKSRPLSPLARRFIDRVKTLPHK